jgi:hypothetical protein
MAAKPQIRFCCGGCYHHGKMRINGSTAGEWHDGYAAFEFRVDHLLQAGDNTIDLYTFMTNNCSAYLQQGNTVLTPDDRQAVAEQVAPAVEFFGAQH